MTRQEWLEFYRRPTSVIFNRTPAGYDDLLALIREGRIAPHSTEAYGSHTLYQTVEATPQMKNKRKRNPEDAKARALAGKGEYSLVRDSNGVDNLKLEGYGYVAALHGDTMLYPRNLGVEIPREILWAGVEQAKRRVKKRGSAKGRHASVQAVWDAALHSSGAAEAAREAHLAQYGRKKRNPAAARDAGWTKVDATNWTHRGPWGHILRAKDGYYAILPSGKYAITSAKTLGEAKRAWVEQTTGRVKANPGRPFPADLEGMSPHTLEDMARKLEAALTPGQMAAARQAADRAAAKIGYPAPATYWKLFIRAMRHYAKRKLNPRQNPSGDPKGWYHVAPPGNPHESFRRHYSNRAIGEVVREWNTLNGTWMWRVTVMPWSGEPVKGGDYKSQKFAKGVADDIASKLPRSR